MPEQEEQACKCKCGCSEPTAGDEPVCADCWLQYVRGNPGCDNRIRPLANGLSIYSFAKRLDTGDHVIRRMIERKLIRVKQWERGGYTETEIDKDQLPIAARYLINDNCKKIRNLSAKNARLQEIAGEGVPGVKGG